MWDVNTDCAKEAVKRHVKVMQQDISSGRFMLVGKKHEQKSIALIFYLFYFFFPLRQDLKKKKTFL